MKLAEALIERAEIQKKNGQLMNRIKTIRKSRRAIPHLRNRRNL